MWSISQKLPWRHSLHFFTGIFTASVVHLQREKINQKKSSSCATGLRPMLIFSNVHMFLQTLQVFGTWGKRSSRWLLPFGRQPESKTRCFVKLLLRDLSTADDSGSAPAFARVCALVSIYFYIVCWQSHTMLQSLCKLHCGFNHIILPRFLFFFHRAKMHKLSGVFQKLSSNTCKSKASQGKNQKINVSMYVKSVLFFSLILRNSRTTLIFFSKYLLQVKFPARHNSKSWSLSK